MAMLRVIDDAEDNSLADMVELRSEAIVQDSVSLLVDLRISTVDIPFAETTFRVGLSAAYLRVQLEGLKVSTGHRLGDINPLQASISSNTQSIKDQKKSLAISGMMGGKIQVTGEVGGKVEFSQKDDQSTAYSHNGIRALPNNCWRVENPAGQNDPIQASILTGQELLRLNTKQSANRMTLDLVLDAAPSEIVVTSKTRKRKIRQVNRERVIQIIATRSILGRTGRRLEPGMTVQFSRVSFEFKKDDDV